MVFYDQWLGVGFKSDLAIITSIALKIVNKLLRFLFKILFFLRFQITIKGYYIVCLFLDSSLIRTLYELRIFLDYLAIGRYIRMP
jgi:hypothetical protein